MLASRINLDALDYKAPVRVADEDALDTEGVLEDDGFVVPPVMQVCVCLRLSSPDISRWCRAFEPCLPLTTKNSSPLGFAVAC